MSGSVRAPDFRTEQRDRAGQKGDSSDQQDGGFHGPLRKVLTNALVSFLPLPPVWIHREDPDYHDIQCHPSQSGG